MKSGTWGEAEERRLVGAVVAHEKKQQQGQQEGQGQGQGQEEGEEPPLRRRKVAAAAGDQWRQISYYVPQR
jgi:hypothetical protein